MLFGTEQKVIRDFNKGSVGANIISRFEVLQSCSALQAENPFINNVSRAFAASEQFYNKKPCDALVPCLHVISSYSQTCNMLCYI